eukprot:44693-Alexandrium_andersonii.AAC.1
MAALNAQLEDEPRVRTPEPEKGKGGRAAAGKPMAETTNSARWPSPQGPGPVFEHKALQGTANARGKHVRCKKWARVACPPLGPTLERRALKGVAYARRKKSTGARGQVPSWGAQKGIPHARPASKDFTRVLELTRKRPSPYLPPAPELHP